MSLNEARLDLKLALFRSGIFVLEIRNIGPFAVGPVHVELDGLPGSEVVPEVGHAHSALILCPSK